MDQYKIETIIAALLGGIAILWHQLVKQIGINRDDQKEFSKLVARNLEVLAETNELMRDIKDIIRYEQKK
tara:strand:- start:285 stop:494 length:210 start_codon:yes stop_codon:yes gene_type:complete